MLYRIYIYRMYVQEGLTWTWVHIYPVSMYFVDFAHSWQLIKFSYCHTPKSQLFALDLSCKINLSVFQQISNFGSVQPIVIKPSMCYLEILFCGDPVICFHRGLIKPFSNSSYFFKTVFLKMIVIYIVKESSTWRLTDSGNWDLIQNSLKFVLSFYRLIENILCVLLYITEDKTAAEC